ncbi:hypothetical protein BJ138DRAFT_1116758 [Hygrophoropsis aurantiaca]|uniref:Uncharacterized protein n=1 Tax=Hygrophoropsis aurantiaca TaxID=72124 RepID=A0ACB8A2W5_9AGAM|nr:hypothetical protein BJ138DRAFT_1116758 [Hygrophoropsis aurantiaca]
MEASSVKIRAWIMAALRSFTRVLDPIKVFKTRLALTPFSLTPLDHQSHPINLIIHSLNYIYDDSGIHPSPRSATATSEPGGRIDSHTSIAIGVALVCFISLLLGFYVVARWKPKSAQAQMEPAHRGAPRATPSRRTTNQSANTAVSTRGAEPEAKGWWFTRLWTKKSVARTSSGPAVLEDGLQTRQFGGTHLSRPRRASIISSNGITIVDDGDSVTDHGKAPTIQNLEVMSPYTGSEDEHGHSGMVERSGMVEGNATEVDKVRDGRQALQ